MKRYNPEDFAVWSRKRLKRRSEAGSPLDPIINYQAKELIRDWRSGYIEQKMKEILTETRFILLKDNLKEKFDKVKKGYGKNKMERLTTVSKYCFHMACYVLYPDLNKEYSERKVLEEIKRLNPHKKSNFFYEYFSKFNVFLTDKLTSPDYLWKNEQQTYRMNMCYFWGLLKDYKVHHEIEQVASQPMFTKIYVGDMRNGKVDELFPATKEQIETINEADHYVILTKK